MTNWTNDCEGSNGVAVTTSNTSGPNQFDAISGTAPTFDSSAAAHGSTCLSFTGASTGWAVWLASLSGIAGTALYNRIYLRLPALPTVTARVVAILTSANVVCGSIQVITGTGGWRLVNNAGSVVATGTATIPTSQWVRIEWSVTNISGTTGDLNAALYLTKDSTTPDDTLSATGTAVGGAAGQVRLGPSSVAAGNIIQVDDVGVSDTAALGPVVTGTDSGPNPASAGADLGGGSGSWTGTGNIFADDATVASWAVP